MGAMIVRQPDGRYARWSSIVDDFTHTDHTYEEMWRVLRGKRYWNSPRATNEAMNNADNEMGALFEPRTLHEPGYRWRWCQESLAEQAAWQAAWQAKMNQEPAS